LREETILYLKSGKFPQKKEEILVAGWS